MAVAQQGRLATLRRMRWGPIAALLLLGAPNLAQAESPWLTGEPLHSALAQKVTVVWSNIPVRKAIEGLCESQKVAFLLDRRIDPDRKIELSLDNVTLAEGLQLIASHLGIGTTMLGPVAYFGPTKTVARLRTVAALRRQDANKLPPNLRANWNQSRPWKWDDLSTPRDLLTALCEENKLHDDGLENVPADLWAHADLPPLTLPEKLTLLLAQFDLTYEPSSDGKSIRLAPMPDKPTLDHLYQVAGLSEEPAAKLSPSEKKSQHTVTTEGRKVYSLQVELPVGQLLQSLGPRLGMEINIDKTAISAAGKSLDTKVKLDVKEVGEDELLRAVLEPAGLTFTRKDNVVDVKPKQ